MTRDNEGDREHFLKRLSDFHDSKDADRVDLALALLNRSPQDRRDAAEELFRTKYPAASSEMIRSGAFHAYLELPTAMRDCMAWLELCLRAKDHEQHSGISFDVVYHMYNWLQVETLIPWGRQDVFDELQEIKDCLTNDDKEGALGTLESLMERFDASVAPPEVET